MVHLQFRVGTFDQIPHSNRATVDAVSTFECKVYPELWSTLVQLWQKSFIFFCWLAAHILRCIIKVSVMFVVRGATVNCEAFTQQVQTSFMSHGERGRERRLWHSRQAYLSLAERHGQEQQLTHSKSHVHQPYENLSTHNKPLILILYCNNKGPFRR